MSSLPARPALPPATHRVSGSAELADAIPYLLGFHPTRSLVLVGLRERRLVVTARLDLDDALLGRTVLATVEAMRRGGSRDLVATVFAEDVPPPGRGDLPHGNVVGLFADAADELRCELVDAVLIADGRMWSYLCAEPDCCPPEGIALGSAPSAFAAAAAYEGVVALPDRAALAATLTPLPDRSALAPALADAEDAGGAAILAGAAARHAGSAKRAIFAAARASATAGWAGLSDPEVARFAAALTDLSVRDAVWLAVDDRRLDGRPLWRDLARRAPSSYDAAPLFLFGWASWRAGDGALAGIAVELALASDPTYSAADLLQAALSHALDPRSFPALAGSIRRAGAAAGVRDRPRRAPRGAAARTPR